MGQGNGVRFKDTLVGSHADMQGKKKKPSYKPRLLTLWCYWFQSPESVEIFNFVLKNRHVPEVYTNILAPFEYTGFWEL